jgi:putative tricarboxylic transport membrane protein
LLTFGIPSGSSTAILLSALILWGVRPGPLMITEHPDVFWGLVASLYIGNAVLLIMNLPLVGVFAQILRVPVYILHPTILGVAVAGAYGVSANHFDISMLIGFGLLGYVMSRIKFPTAPLILGFVLGIPMERAIRQSLAMSGGDPSILVERPIPAVLLVLAAIILMMPLWRKLRPPRSGSVHN